MTRPSAPRVALRFASARKTAALTAKIPASVLYDKGRGGWEYDLGGFADWPSFRKKPKREQVAWAKEFVGSGGQIREPVDITVYSDGGVKFEDGHHRVIAGALLDLDIPVRVRFINFDKDLWPDLLTLLRAGYTRRQYNPQDWSLKGSGVPPLDVVRRGPDAADEWIMSNERVKTAARPIRLNRGDVDRLIDRLYRKIGARFDAGTIGTHRDAIAMDAVHIEDVFGNEKEVLVALTAKPGAGGFVLGGGFGHVKRGRDKGKPIIIVQLNGAYTWEGLLNARMSRDDLRNVLMHELSHAADKAKRETGAVQGRIPTSGEIDMAEYVNDPSEVRAHMRELYEELRTTVTKVMGTSLGEMWGLGGTITRLIRDNRTWKEIEPHLTRKNRNRILKGLVTAFEDEGVGSVSVKRVASRHLEAKYDKYAPRDARKVLSTHLSLRPGNPDPELDEDVRGQNTPWAPILQRARQWSLPEFTEHMEQYAFNENIEVLERELAEEPLLYRVVQNGKTRARGNTSEEWYRSGNLRERIEDYHKYDRWMQKGGPWEIVVKPRPKSDYRKLDTLKKMRVVREKEWADLYKRLRSTDSAEIVEEKNSANGIQFLVQNHKVFVGGISAASAGTSDDRGRSSLISDDCWKDIRTLAEEYGDGTVWTVVSSTLWPEYRRKGLGTKLYESVIHALRSKPGGPHYLIPHGCWGGMGNTSPDARRVWKKLWSRYPSSGAVIVVGG